jgi:hypothetical protein
MNCWKIIADNLSKAGWSWGKRFVVRADEKLTAFLELESGVAARKARPYIKIRCCLTRQVYAVFVKNACRKKDLNPGAG